MKIEKILDRKTVIVDELNAETLDDIARRVSDEYQLDKESRSEWEIRMEKAMNLALQVAEVKNTPWPDASNIKFPLLTIASLQFSSRIYPSLIGGTDIVNMRVIGGDPDGQKTARADRVSKHMSYQNIEQDESWEEEMDRLLITIPIMGCGFKKRYYDPIKGHQISENVLPKDLIVPYFAKSIETASRITHVIELRKNQIEERIRKGIYAEVELTTPVYETEKLQLAQDVTQGMKHPDNDPDAPYTLLEQHRYLDLDKDGYDEPYIVTVTRDQKKVMRIVPRFRAEDIEFDEIKNRIKCIRPRHHFIKFPFIPSPDGGFYDLGFGALLTPISDSVDTIINQLVDLGTWNNQVSGFIGKGARMKSGVMRFKPFHFEVIQTSGSDLKSNIVMNPTRDPSPVLFNLLKFMVDYAERIMSVSEMMVGKTPGQNTPATTTMAALEEGMKVFTAIYKRIYRSLRSEFRIQYRLNQEYLDPKEYYAILDSGDTGEIFQQDYMGDPTDIRPSADPNIASPAQKVARWEMLSQRAASIPGYDIRAVELRGLKSMNIEAVEEIYPTEKPIQPPPDPKMELEKSKIQLKATEAYLEHKLVVAELSIKALKIDAEITALNAQAIKSLADAEAAEAGQQMGEYKHQLEEMKFQRDNIMHVIAELKSGGMNGMEQPSGGMNGSGGLSGVEEPSSDEASPPVL